MKKKVIVAGHICLDITPIFSAGNICPKGNTGAISDLLTPGKLVSMEEADVHTGGVVANTGLAMRLLGMEAILIGKVGEDAFGGIVREILSQYGAADGLIMSKELSTSYSIVIAPPGIDRIFLHHAGANHSFSAEDVTEAQLCSAALLHFGYPPLMRQMYLNNGEELVKLMKKAKENHAATSMDLAAVDPHTEAGRADWREILEAVCPYVDFFAPSIEELCFMLDRPRYEEWTERAAGGELTGILDVDRDIRPVADLCMELGCKVLLLKCGAPGLYYKTASEERLESIGCATGIVVSDWADREGFEKSYVPERVLSGTGAGDTTIAAFLSAMLQGYSFENCIHLASAAGASCVEAYDALSGLKSLELLEQKIKQGWKKQGGGEEDLC